MTTQQILGCGGVVIATKIPITNFQTDYITITVNGQTSLPLSLIPIDNADIILIVNGVIYLQGLDYTIAFAVITWTNATFQLNIGDQIQIYYQVA